MIKVKDVIGKQIAISSDDAKKLKDVIIDALDSKENIEISFEGIDMLISHFFNVSIGELYTKYEEKQWNILDNIQYTGISDDDLELLQKRVIPSFKHPPADRERFLKIQDDILK